MICTSWTEKLSVPYKYWMSFYGVIITKELESYGSESESKLIIYWIWFENVGARTYNKKDWKLELLEWIWKYTIISSRV